MASTQSRVSYISEDGTSYQINDSEALHYIVDTSADGTVATNASNINSLYYTTTSSQEYYLNGHKLGILTRDSNDTDSSFSFSNEVIFSEGVSDGYSKIYTDSGKSGLYSNKYGEITSPLWVIYRDSNGDIQINGNEEQTIINGSDIVLNAPTTISNPLTLNGTLTGTSASFSGAINATSLNSPNATISEDGAITCTSLTVDGKIISSSSPTLYKSITRKFAVVLNANTKNYGTGESPKIFGANTTHNKTNEQLYCSMNAYINIPAAGTGFNRTSTTASGSDGTALEIANYQLVGFTYDISNANSGKVAFVDNKTNVKGKNASHCTLFRVDSSGIQIRGADLEGEIACIEVEISFHFILKKLSILSA